MLRIIRKIIGYIFLIPIYFYKWCISPFTPASCRHTPTCSAYFIEAVKIHGPIRGSWMGIKRLSKCHPWGTHGYDPVPIVPIKKYNPKNIIAKAEKKKATNE